MKQGLRLRVTGLLAVLLLAACNGGGGGFPGGGEEPPPPGADLQTSVPSPTYAADSKALAYFNKINAAREKYGVGLLAQNAALDVAAGHHAGYLDEHGWADAWNGLESPAGTLFTGLDEQARCDHAGFAGTCPRRSGWSEVVVRAGRSTHPGYFGLSLLTQGARQVGLAMHQTALFTGEVNGPELQLGYPSGTTPQHPAPGFLLVAALSEAFQVQVNAGETLSITAFQVWNALGVELAGTLLTQANDPLQRVPAHAALFVPGTAVPCSGQYTVHVAGTRGTTPFTVDRVLDLADGPYCLL